MVLLRTAKRLVHANYKIKLISTSKNGHSQKSSFLFYIQDSVKEGNKARQNIEQLISTLNDWAMKVTNITKETKDAMSSYLKNNRDDSDIISEDTSILEQSRGKIIVYMRNRYVNITKKLRTNLSFLLLIMQGKNLMTLKHAE